MKVDIKRRILIVEDDKLVAGLIYKVLLKENHIVDTVQNGQEALNKFKDSYYDLVISDICMPVMDGLELLKELKNISNSTEVVLITGFGNINDAVEAMKLGASDYITKPIAKEQLKLITERIFEKQNLINEISLLKKELKERYSFSNIIGKSHKMQELYDIISTVSSSEANVLITGETGTGKELVAKAIHFNSLRKDNHFVPINCATLPETIVESELFGYESGAFSEAKKRKIGKFEFCQGGTMFLDEAANIPLSIQAKLLRVLQEKKIERLGGNETINVDFRIVAATNKDLKDAVCHDKFRDDLYFRLNVIPINVPPLRERSEDIPLLVNHFIEKYNKINNKNIKGVSHDVLSALISYDWPGNVRELENIAERSVIMAKKDLITDIDLPVDISTTLTKKGPENLLVNDKILNAGLQLFIENCEKEYLKKVLEKFNGNVKASSQYAKTEDKTFYRRMKKYNLRKDEFGIADNE